jgi:hypothetical protein
MTEAGALTGPTGTGEPIRGTGPRHPTGPEGPPTRSTRVILTAAWAARPAAEAAGGAILLAQGGVKACGPAQPAE